jgi:hypothetical protein
MAKQKCPRQRNVAIPWFTSRNVDCRPEGDDWTPEFSPAEARWFLGLVRRAQSWRWTQTAFLEILKILRGSHLKYQNRPTSGSQAYIPGSWHRTCSPGRHPREYSSIEGYIGQQDMLRPFCISQELERPAPAVKAVRRTMASGAPKMVRLTGRIIGSLVRLGSNEPVRQDIRFAGQSQTDMDRKNQEGN